MRDGLTGPRTAVDGIERKGCVSRLYLARKPWPGPREREPDHVAWEAPSRFLVGYGMDAGGQWRGLPYVGAVG